MNQQTDTQFNFHCQAIALIRRWVGHQCEWLVINAREPAVYKLISAERLEQESFRVALKRELAWILPLTPDRDYIVSSVPRLHFRHLVEKHGCDGTDSVIHLITEFYLVDLYGSKAEEVLGTLPRYHWINSEQLNAGNWQNPHQPVESCSLDRQQLKLLELSQVVSPWEGTTDW